MAICPVCGCKTDDLDFIESNLNGKEIKTCSFCNRQLNSFKNDSVGESNLRWLSSVLSKDTQREMQLTEDLKALAEKYALPEDTQPISDSMPKPKSYNNTKSQNFDSRDRVIAQLTARVEKLEKDLIKMKRTQLIKSAAEILIPIILGIIILIVFFSTGLFDTLSGLYGQFT